MSYLHIQNLYRPEAQDILLFKRCYAMEKIHGSSAHCLYKDGALHFFAGGTSHESFLALFDQPALLETFQALGHDKVCVYGEAYGGKMQGMSKTYGTALHFIVFDVKIDESWLVVPQAEDVATKLGLEFVPYVEIDTDLVSIDAERDRPSEVAARRGCGTDKPREGIVLRPLIEVTKNNGERVIAKHKGEAFAERIHPPKVVDPTKLAVLTEATAIADEWVTDQRLRHVLDKLPQRLGIKDTPVVIKAMLEDVLREAAGEIVDSKEARGAICKKTAQLFHTRLKAQGFSR